MREGHDPFEDHIQVKEGKVYWRNPVISAVPWRPIYGIADVFVLSRHYDELDAGVGDSVRENETIRRGGDDSGTMRLETFRSLDVVFTAIDVFLRVRP